MVESVRQNQNTCIFIVAYRLRAENVYLPGVLAYSLASFISVHACDISQVNSLRELRIKRVIIAQAQIIGDLRERENDRPAQTFIRGYLPRCVRITGEGFADKDIF